MPLGAEYLFEQDLEKRALNGAYVYVIAWLLIGFTTGYSELHQGLFWEIAAAFLVLGGLRLMCYHGSSQLMSRSRRLWYSCFWFNSLGPPLVFGGMFALSMASAAHEVLFNFLLMGMFALLSGGVVSFSTHRVLATTYLLALTVPALWCGFLLPIDRGAEGSLLLLYMIFMSFQIKRLNQEYRLRIEQRRELETLAKVDGMTGIYNRRYFDEMLAFYWKSHLRVHEPLGLLLMDIDNFKKVNDNYGHPAGDEVIREVARIIGCSFRRETDVVARTGGEEFAVLMSQAGIEFLQRQAEKIRSDIEQRVVAFEGQKISVTVSIGLIVLLPSESSSRSAFYKAVDDCLYQAKEQGRNRVVAQFEL